jgi:hypothetical protein
VSVDRICFPGWIVAFFRTVVDCYSFPWTPLIRPWRLRAKLPCSARPEKQASDPLEVRTTMLRQLHCHGSLNKKRGPETPKKLALRLFFVVGVRR